MTESKMRKALSEQYGKNHIIQSIESGGTGIGIPDIFFRTQNKEGWIELKQVRQSAKGKVNIPFRPGQISWIQRYIKRNGLVILLCSFSNHFPDRGYLFAFKGKNIWEEYSINQFYDASYWQGTIEYFPF